LDNDDDALELVAALVYSAAFSARFLERVIDDQVKFPITMPWNDGAHFRVRAIEHALEVQAVPARLDAAVDQAPCTPSDLLRANVNVLRGRLFGDSHQHAASPLTAASQLAVAARICWWLPAELLAISMPARHRSPARRLHPSLSC
jgi:hypothetical protein